MASKIFMFLILLILVTLLTILIPPAYAGREQGVYLEYGLGVHNARPKTITNTISYRGEVLEYSSSYPYSMTDSATNPIGILKLYYRSKNDWEAGILHLSSVPDRDLYGGYNLLYATRRVRLF